MSNLGRLQQVNLREVWQNEASGFTPWLAQEDNLILLGETLGVELELEAQEKDVGPFRADILCKDTITNQWVLVENQLERTDHTHLGQLITYAAGLEAVTIVWIADHFTEEHRAALDWLNEISDESAYFFGLEIELWHIGDSPVAPKFNIVSQPNEWTKTVAKVARQGERLSETQQFQLDFWSGFRDYLEEHGSEVKPPNPAPRHWMSFAAGRSNFYFLTFVNTRENLFGVGLVLQGPDAKSHLSTLMREKETVEEQIGEALEWRELPDNIESQIMLVQYETDPTRQGKWLEYYAWMAEKIDAFHATLRPLIKKMDASDSIPDA